MLTLQSLHIYPIKSCAGLSIPTADVAALGLAGDRRWMLVDEAGKFVTQREYPAMATLVATPNLVGLTLSAPGRAPCEVAKPAPDAPRVTVTVWKSTLQLPVAEEIVNSWCSRTLGHPVRLVYLDDEAARVQTSSYAKEGDVVSLADGFPLLITTTASLDALNAAMDSPVPMNRFRPNLVIDGADAWAEDSWREIKIGDVVLELMKPCSRCAITQVDQASGQSLSKEPIRTLRRLRFAPHYTGVLFGVNATARSSGQLHIGQTIEILKTRIPPELRLAAAQ
jgi:uncharacterized protein YcbX